MMATRSFFPTTVVPPDSQTPRGRGLGSFPSDRWTHDPREWDATIVEVDRTDTIVFARLQRDVLTGYYPTRTAPQSTPDLLSNWVRQCLSTTELKREPPYLSAAPLGAYGLARKAS